MSCGFLFTLSCIPFFSFPNTSGKNGAGRKQAEKGREETVVSVFRFIDSAAGEKPQGNE